MSIFILLTRLIREEVHPSFTMYEKEKLVVNKIQGCLPSVKWMHNYALTGPWDYLDIFEATDLDEAMKVSALVRHYGGAHTELWPAQTWEMFESSIQDLAEYVRQDVATGGHDL